MNIEYVLGQLTNLLAIDSPSGYTKDVTDYLLKEFETLGFPAHRTVKGGVIADLGGEDADNAISVSYTHLDVYKRQDERAGDRVYKKAMLREDSDLCNP